MQLDKGSIVTAGRINKLPQLLLLVIKFINLDGSYILVLEADLHHQSIFPIYIAGFLDIYGKTAEIGVDGKFIVHSAIGGFQCFLVYELVGSEDGLEIEDDSKHQKYFLYYFGYIFNFYLHFLQLFEYVFIHSEKSRIVFILYFHFAGEYASL